MTEHTLNTFTQTQRPVFFSIYTLQYNRGTGKLLGKRGNIFPNSENKITLSHFLVKHAFTLELCSSLFQTGDTQSYPQCDCLHSALSIYHMQLSADWFQFVDFNVLWEGTLSHQESPFSNFQIVLQHGATKTPCKYPNRK